MLSIGNSIKERNVIGSLNISSIFSELIQAAGMGCENYASDLFYDLTAIDSDIKNGVENVRYIGIRTYGVDSNTFMRSRLDNKSCNYSPNCYIKIYRISISVDGEYMTVLLERIDEYEAKNALCK